MGLDLVETVIAIEHHFGIEIPNAAAERMRTPRDIIDYMSTRLVGTRIVREPALPCPTQQAFYRVRSALQANIGLPKREIIPTTRLQDVVPLEGRAALWERLHHCVSENPRSHWPSLHLSRGLSHMLLVTIAGTFLIMLVAGATSEYPRVGMTVALFGTAALSFAAYKLTASRRCEFAPPRLTVGDLARVVAIPATLERAKPEHWTRERIAQDVRAIVMFELGVDVVTDDSRFVEDLGAS